MAKDPIYLKDDFRLATLRISWEVAIIRQSGKTSPVMRKYGMITPSGQTLRPSIDL